MIFCEYAAPMPGSASSCSLVAVLMSSRSAEASGAIVLLLDEADACAKLLVDMPAIRVSAKTTTDKRAIKFLRMISPLILKLIILFPQLCSRQPWLHPQS